MPWNDRTLVGTTESEFKGDPNNTPALEEEVQYLRDVFQTHFPDRDSTVLNHWAGLRVLPSASGAAFKRSRETMLPVDNVQRPRWISIYGGKLTGYRATAQKVMKILSKTLPGRTPLADTRQLGLEDPWRDST